LKLNTKINFKAGEIVCVSIDNKVIRDVKLKSFFHYGMLIESHTTIPVGGYYYFYASGYANAQQFIVCRKRWHLFLAKFCEFIRLFNERLYPVRD